MQNQNQQWNEGRRQEGNQQRSSNSEWRPSRDNEQDDNGRYKSAFSVQSSNYGGGSSFGSEGAYRNAGYRQDQYSSYGEGGGSGTGMRNTNRGYSQESGGRDYDQGADRYRGFWDKAGDEVSSWFGDDEAERRRDMDQQREDDRRMGRSGGSGYGGDTAGGGMRAGNHSGMSSGRNAGNSAQTGRHRGKGPKNYKRSDDRIKEEVCDRLSDDAHIDASDIEIEVSNGEVTLSGTVSERNAKRHAEDLAEEVSGVTNVENRIRVKSESGSTSGQNKAAYPSAGSSETAGADGSAKSKAATA